MNEIPDDLTVLLRPFGHPLVESDFAGARTAGDVRARAAARLSSPPGRVELVTRGRLVDVCFVDEIEEIPPYGARRILEIKQLYLPSLKLGTLPDSIGQLGAARDLCLGSNHLLGLPESFGKLQALERLWLHSNRLCSLPQSFGQLPRLQELHLQDNRLRALPDARETRASKRLQISWSVL
ncbi:unnamed protein product [Prorocentrum cordatum]|uniref:Leucine-rich repeat domain-containing protein n=1 Tax=Prorocentrum cordatum TaxID=2364126 RepID=A0ABN9SY15_9DINO|nr:unnamed protein product [Polarella glacialis]